MPRPVPVAVPIPAAAGGSAQQAEFLESAAQRGRRDAEHPREQVHHVVGFGLPLAHAERLVDPRRELREARADLLFRRQDLGRERPRLALFLAPPRLRDRRPRPGRAAGDEGGVPERRVAELLGDDPPQLRVGIAAPRGDGDYDAAAVASDRAALTRRQRAFLHREPELLSDLPDVDGELARRPQGRPRPLTCAGRTGGRRRAGCGRRRGPGRCGRSAGLHERLQGREFAPRLGRERRARDFHFDGAARRAEPGDGVFARTVEERLARAATGVAVARRTRERFAYHGNDDCSTGSQQGAEGDWRMAERADAAGADALIGTWRLVSWQVIVDEAPPQDLFGTRPRGYLILTREGRSIVLTTAEHR